MSSVLHPVGPEPVRTYWARRAAVVAAAIVLLSVIIALIVNGSTSGSAAEPPVDAVPAPASTSTTEATTPATSTPTGGATRSSASPATSGKPSATGAASSTATPNPGPVACAAKDLRVTLTGKRRLKVKKPNTFKLSVINGSGSTCIATVNKKNFELKIYSGTDRIWSSNDCSTAVKPIRTKLAAERVSAWTMRWNGRRSADDCKNRPEIPQGGTYFATAQLEGAEPVQLRMILVG